MPEDRTRHDVLARIADDPQLARAVPRLAPEILHAVIVHRGLPDCGELLALTTSEQLSAVLDLDLWKTKRGGAAEQFDAARFCEWIEALVDTGPTIAADRLAKMDAALVVAGLSRNIAVFDPAVFAPAIELSGADPVFNAGRERGEHAEIGGYIVVARRPEAWGAIVDALRALDEQHAETFQRVMRGCRRLSDSGREIDGLDDLLSDPEQVDFDLSLSREERRDRLGFLPPQQACAFLDSARQTTFTTEPPPIHPVFAAYQRSVAGMSETDEISEQPPSVAQAEPPSDDAASVATLVEILRGSGLLADSSRALLTAAPDEPSSVHTALNRYMQRCAERADAAWMARSGELAFLANALMAGSSVQGRSFTPREASSAAAAICNLGLECWPQQWGASLDQDLVAAFRVGWTVLHRDVSMVTAHRLLDALDRVRTSDRDLQMGLIALRRELQKHRQAGTPWRASGKLDVLASLDLPTWAALVALLDECPVMLTNVRPSSGRRPHTVNPSEFQFIANAGDVAAVREFLGCLAERLTETGS